MTYERSSDCINLRNLSETPARSALLQPMMQHTAFGEHSQT
jgi:hypothetical protein